MTRSGGGSGGSLSANRWHRRAALLGWLILVAGGMVPAWLAPAWAAPPEAVQQTLDRYASLLRSTGWQGPPAGDALAADLGWVQPGNADASALYNRLLAAPSPPLEREVEGLKAWIDALPPPIPVTCAAGPAEPRVLSHDAIAARVAADLDGQLPLRRPKLRYLSLVALTNRCAFKGDEASAAVKALLARIAPAAKTALPVQLPGDTPVWRVDLDELKLSEQTWAMLSRHDGFALELPSPKGSGGAIPGARMLRVDALAASRVPGTSGGRDDKPEPGSPLAMVAAAYSAPLDAEAAAAELGVSAGTFRRFLYGSAPRQERIQLSAWISRETFTQWYPRLAAALTGARLARPSDPRPAELAGGTVQAERYVPPKLTLSAERALYSSGDLARFSVSTAIACDLELVGVDPSGRATLLFPNDFQRESTLTAGTKLDFPGEAAPFQLRLDKIGTETVIAHCYPPRSRRPRAELDYARERFLDLGSWRDARGLDPPQRGRAPRNAKAVPARLLARAAVRLKVR